MFMNQVGGMMQSYQQLGSINQRMGEISFLLKELLPNFN